MKTMKSCIAAVFAVSCALAADDHVKIENDLVRVLDVTDTPHLKSPVHEHAFNRVMIYWNAGEMTISYVDGHVVHQHWHAKQVAWSPAGGKHVSENVGDIPIRIVEVELKQPAPQSPPQRDASLDPLAIDPKHNVLEFENDQVRVFRCWREPGATESMHQHTGRGRVAVLLTDLDAKIQTPDGASSTEHALAGTALFSAGSVTHAGTNLGVANFEMIIVEVK